MEIKMQYKGSNVKRYNFTRGHYYSFNRYNGDVLVQDDFLDIVPMKNEEGKDFDPVIVVREKCWRCEGLGKEHTLETEQCWICKGEGFEYKSAMAWVNVYTISRSYGGPEEGGWYYDAYEFVEGYPVLREEAEKMKETLTKEHADLEWGDISSVLGGETLYVGIEEWQAYSETTERPIYE